MKKIGCLIFFVGIILAINSCNESRIHDEELLKSSAGYDEIIDQAETWYNDTPEENCYPLLEFSDGLEWNKALVHELDTATIVEVPIKIKNKHEIEIKDESNLNVDYRLLVVIKEGETTSLCEFIISDIEKEKIKNIKKINYTSTDFNGSILLVNNIGDIVTVKHFIEAEEQSAEMNLKSVKVRCLVLVAIHPDGTKQIVGVLYCYQIVTNDGGGGGSTTDVPDIDPEDCDCEICSVCGGCIGSLKSIPIPPEDGGEPTEETTDCPMCSCPKIDISGIEDNDKVFCIYENLIKTAATEYNPLVTSFLMNFSDDLSINPDDIIFELEPLSGYGECDASGDKYVITLNSNEIDNRAPIEIAKTFIHEILHALIANKLDKSPDNFISDFREYIGDDGYVDQHQLMMDHYVNPMIQFLKDYDSLLGRNASYSYYQSLALSGLEAVISQEEMNNLIEAQNYFRQLGLTCD